MKLLPLHRKFIIVNQGIVSTVFNFFLNMGIAWFLYRSLEKVPLWGSLSIGFDTLATSFVLPALTCYFIAVTIGIAVRKGWMPVIVDYPRTGIVGKIAGLPVVAQGVVHGVAGTALLGVPVTVWFVLTGNEFLSFHSFLWFKASYAAVLSLAVSPVIGLFALFSRTQK
ncbi:MAG: hypothetical protein JXA71_13975 [Chitinispirillaceae bacterium]|nr:hypothetical protein [Chitinispirillaceae bacterium]